MANRLGGSGEKSCKSAISQGTATVRFSTKTANFSSRAIALDERPCASCTDVARDEMPDRDLENRSEVTNGAQMFEASLILTTGWSASPFVEPTR
jgi:hypothetical protein